MSAAFAFTASAFVSTVNLTCWKRIAQPSARASLFRIFRPGSTHVQSSPMLLSWPTFCRMPIYLFGAVPWRDCGRNQRQEKFGLSRIAKLLPNHQTGCHSMIGDGPPLVLDRKQVEAAHVNESDALQRAKGANLENNRRKKRRHKQQNMTITRHALITLARSSQSWGAGQEGSAVPACLASKNSWRFPRKRDRTVLRLFSAVAKESAFSIPRPGRSFI